MSFHDGLTGGLFEWEVLGKPLVEGSVVYVPYLRAMALCKDIQRWDPTSPRRLAARKLHALICRVLRQVGMEDQYGRVPLYFYSALGTPLDKFHGVDCWFEFAGQVVTIDLTCNGKKDEHKAKADVRIRPEDIEEDGGAGVARHIALLLASCRRNGAA